MKKFFDFIKKIIEEIFCPDLPHPKLDKHLGPTPDKYPSLIHKIHSDFLWPHLSKIENYMKNII